MTPDFDDDFSSRPDLFHGERVKIAQRAGKHSAHLLLDVPQHARLIARGLRCPALFDVPLHARIVTRELDGVALLDILSANGVVVLMAVHRYDVRSPAYRRSRTAPSGRAAHRTQPAFGSGAVVFLDSVHKPRLSNHRQRVLDTASGPGDSGCAGMAGFVGRRHRTAAPVKRRSPMLVYVPVARPQPQGHRDFHDKEHEMIIRPVLVSIAIAVGSAVAVTAPASADANAFGGLGCHCRETTKPASPAQRDEMNRGIRDGLAATSSG
jgi:hypothetical protein